MVNMLDWGGLASRANALLPVDYLFSEFLPLARVKVRMILIAPFWLLGFAGIHREPVNAYDWILGHGRKKPPNPPPVIPVE